MSTETPSGEASSSPASTKAANSNVNKKPPRSWRRTHGLQPPLHPQQLMSWTFLAFFSLLTFAVLVPAFHDDLHLPLHVFHAVLYAVHAAVHVAAVVVDPADPNLRKLDSKKPVPEFNR